MQLKVETRTPKEGVAVIDLEGEVDVYTSPRLKQEMVDLLNRGLVNLIVDPQGRPQHESPADGDDRDDRDELDERDPRRACRRRLCQRRHERQRRKHGQDGEILKQEDAEGRASVLRFQLVALGQHLQHEGSGGERQAEADDCRRHGRQAEPPGGSS